ncbi:MAG: hypothetical protein QXP78_04390, partial [Candidatus Bathyarchaeia archaeon]
APQSLIIKILDWVKLNALQPNGDFYFPEEEYEYKNMQRAYRPLTFLKVAAWLNHPLSKDPLVISRILQYQHETGGVFNYIGEDPKIIEEQPTIGCLNTSFFGHLMIALNRREEAIKAGEWIKKFIEKNQKYMRRGVMYTQMTVKGELVTHIREGEKIIKMVNNKDPKQEFWQIGTCMAYLCVLYEKMIDEWDFSEREASPYLETSLKLLKFEKTMPLYTYFWPSKCKVGWGAGELLRILLKYRIKEEFINDAYDICKKVAIFTFIDNQLYDGGWPCMHYPLSEETPEIEFNYKPLKGIVNIPEEKIPNSKTIFLPREEITGEFLGEMKSIEKGITELLKFKYNFKW